MRARLAAAFGAAALVFTGVVVAADAAPAGGIAINPVRLELAPGQKGAALTLTNEGAARRTVQAEVVAWTQSAGADVYVPTQDLLVNPPLFFLAPGASQVVRVGRPRPAAASAAERCYRIYFSEVPPAPGAEDAGSLRLALRIGIPLFESPAQVHRELAWTATVGPDGVAQLSVANTGNVHARIALLTLVDGAGHTVATVDGFSYVLAGQSHQWQVQLPTGPLPGLRARMELEPGRAEFPVALRTP